MKESSKQWRTATSVIPSIFSLLFSGTVCLSSLYMLAMRISIVFMAKNEKAGFAFVGQVIVRRCPALNGLLKENEK